MVQTFEHLDSRLGARDRQDQQRLGDHRPDLAVALQRGEIDQPGAIGEGCFQRAGEFDGKPRLADPAGTDQGQQPRFQRHLGQLVELPLAPQERAQVGRQVAAGRFAFSPDRREGVRQVGGRDLVHPDRFDALEMVVAEVGELERRPQQVGGKPLHGDARQQDLIGVGGALQPHGRRQSGAEEVVSRRAPASARCGCRTGSEAARWGPRKCWRISRCASIAAITASSGRSKIASTPSPVERKGSPAWRRMAACRIWSCRSMAFIMSLG